jgi:UDP-glucose 4-epimerase
MPVIPTILGFDPRVQFIHEDDMADCLEHAVRHDLDGIFNCAADGVLVLSEVIDLVGKTMAPVLPPWGTGPAVTALRRLRAPLYPEMVPQLRFGRALDNRRFKATGFRYRWTTREAVLRLREQQRLEPILRHAIGTTYRYEAAVEEFLRFSPSVRQPNARPLLPSNTAPRARRTATDSFSDLRAKEILALLPSLSREDLTALREHEAAHAQRPTVLRGIDRLLERHEASAH